MQPHRIKKKAIPAPLIMALVGVVLAALLAALLPAAGWGAPSKDSASPAAASGFRLPWWSMDSGGTPSQAGGYRLNGAIGQPDTALLAGGGYRLAGGYWRPAGHNLFLPVMNR